MESSNQFLGTERISKLMQKYAIPCIISLLVGALYNIVDQIFIANASYLGSYGNAANTVVFPLTVVALAIAVMIGDGCCAFVSISLGQNEVPKAKRSVGNAVVMCLVSSIVLAALYLVFADNILAMFGGTVNAETYHHSQEYFFYITLGVPFYMFGQAMNPIIRADGNPRFAMISTLAGAVLNIILDPVFIFGLRWGMMGAAVATVIGQLVTAALAVWYLLHMKIIRPEKGDYRLKGSICGRTLTLGMTSFLSQISLVAAMAAINNMIRKYGALDTVFGQEQYAQIPMAVVGIVMKFFQIVISIVVGMAAGCTPRGGFQHGRKKACPCEGAVHKTASGRSHRGCRCTGAGGAASPAAHHPVWCCQRERLLHRLCREILPHLPVHDHSGLCQQGLLHLFAGHGQGSGIHRPVHGA